MLFLEKLLKTTFHQDDCNFLPVCFKYSLLYMTCRNENAFIQILNIYSNRKCGKKVDRNTKFDFLKQNSDFFSYPKMFYSHLGHLAGIML